MAHGYLGPAKALASLRRHRDLQRHRVRINKLSLSPENVLRGLKEAGKA